MDGLKTHTLSNPLLGSVLQQFIYLENNNENIYLQICTTIMLWEVIHTPTKKLNINKLVYFFSV